ncbi:class I SAM-dependent methyltransferase [Leptolyngbya sp. AN03gr2]|uniref:class I SAM-dependent methyltransferase n=1 Tax=Leptolyngbya sp. AN03gr2 TaxID=3423364 RepID=UPI003D315C79
MGLVQMIDRRFYPQFDRNWDDVLFREKLLAFVHPQAMVLDFGAGAGIVEAMNFRGLAARVCGIDLDPRVTVNPFLDEGLVADNGRIPYPDEIFDVVFADNVMEHLDQPDQIFAEIARVLRPGGKLLFKTPNKTHYMPLIARLTPHRFHQWINRKRGRDETDTFPTRYRCNTPADVREIARRAGLAVDWIELIEGRPEYLRVSAPTYFAGLGYERLVNATDFLARFRILMIANLSKPEHS